jgi:dTDP-4-amino-4,6-dideoxygalactose transaminase
VIPCADPRAGYDSRREEIGAAVRRVFESGHYILGQEVRGFEQAFASYLGVEHAVGVNSGTDALTLTLTALGVGPGDEVITVSHTALATVAAVLASGATPVLVDVDPEYWTIDPAAVQRAISARTKAIVPVHLYGAPADLSALLAIADAAGVPVVEDCAQATGASYQGRRVGTRGRAGCFSFYPTKNLGALGDGGAVVTADAALAERIRRLRQYGWDDQRQTVAPGVNSRLDEMQAAILSVKLPTLDADNERRRVLADRYRQRLARLPLLLPREPEQSRHVYHLFVVVSAERDRLQRKLAESGVGAGVHYPIPAHRHNGYDERCRVADGGLPNTDRLAASVLSLPMYPELEIEAVDQVCAALAAACVGTGAGSGR